MRKTLIGMAAIVLIGGLGAAACSAAPAEEPTSTPAPAAVSPEADSSAEDTQRPPVDLPVGETYEIALDSNPTTGYGWQVEYNDGDLELVEQRYEPDSDLVGAGGKEVFVFRGRTVSSG
ncbi:MAG: protease inhibitor I42 family protein, partial [Chloroflexi bacterium]|nr:protease inhibitor I42 family protein [Chloroflexota bacterium]